MGCSRGDRADTDSQDLLKHADLTPGSVSPLREGSKGLTVVLIAVGAIWGERQRVTAKGKAGGLCLRLAWLGHAWRLGHKMAAWCDGCRQAELLGPSQVFATRGQGLAALVHAADRVITIVKC